MAAKRADDWAWLGTTKSPPAIVWGDEGTTRKSMALELKLWKCERRDWMADNPNPESWVMVVAPRLMSWTTFTGLSRVPADRIFSIMSLMNSCWRAIRPKSLSMSRMRTKAR